MFTLGPVHPITPRKSSTYARQNGSPESTISSSYDPSRASTWSSATSTVIQTPTHERYSYLFTRSSVSSITSDGARDESPTLPQLGAFGFEWENGLSNGRSRTSSQGVDGEQTFSPVVLGDEGEVNVLKGKGRMDGERPHVPLRKMTPLTSGEWRPFIWSCACSTCPLSLMPTPSLLCL